MNLCKLYLIKFYNSGSALRLSQFLLLFQLQKTMFDTKKVKSDQKIIISLTFSKSETLTAAATAIYGRILSLKQKFFKKCPGFGSFYK
jgi:hypothetical protein